MLHRSPELMSKDRSRLLLIDMQERIVPVIHEHESLTKNCQILLQAADLFNVPVTATEQ